MSRPSLKNRKQFKFPGAQALVELEKGSGDSVPLSKLRPSKNQPRRYFDPDAIAELVESAKKHGILMPLLVRPIVGDEQLYEVVAGERRFHAATKAKLATVPVIIKELSDDEAFEIALFENIHRRDLNPLEEAEAVLTILGHQLNQPREWVVNLFNRAANSSRKSAQEVRDTSEWGTVEEFFTLLSITPESFRANRLSLLKLPKDILSTLETGKIEYSKALLISRVKDGKARKDLLAKCVDTNMTQAEVKAAIRELKQKGEPPKDEMELRVSSVLSQVKKQQVWKSKASRKRLDGLLSELEGLLE